jgi:Abi-like protein
MQAGRTESVRKIPAITAAFATRASLRASRAGNPPTSRADATATPATASPAGTARPTPRTRPWAWCYAGRMPIWVAIEVWDFGMLSRIFSGLQSRDRNAVAHAYGLFEGDVLRSWLRTFNFVRNVAAHHSRLWNRTLTEIPKLPPLERCRHLEFLHRDTHALEKLFGALSCMRFLVRRIAPDSLWHRNLRAHAATFPITPLVSLELPASKRVGWNCPFGCELMT